MFWTWFLFISCAFAFAVLFFFLGCWFMTEKKPSVPEQPLHVHRWIDARNNVILSGEFCIECGTIREFIYHENK